MHTSSVTLRKSCVLVAIMLLPALGASCSPDAADAPETTSAGAAGTPTTTSAQATTIATVTTTTVQPGTTTTAAPATTTTTTFPTEAASNYLRDLLSAETGVKALVEQVRSVNDQWDNRSGGSVSYSDTEAALEDAIQRTRDLVEAFASIEAPSGIDFSQAHRMAATAVGRMPDMVSEMLDGLRSADTGEARRAALVRLEAVFDIFTDAIEQVASMVGNVGTGALQSPDDETTTTAAASDAIGRVEAQWWHPGVA